MNAKKGTWIAGTAFISVVIMAMAWFLLVSPVLATAADTQSQTESTEAQNADLQIKVNKLKADFAHIDEYKADLAKIAKQITPTLDLAPYIRQIDEIATEVEVSVQIVEPLAPYLVLLPEGYGQSTTDGSGAISTEAPAPAPSPSPSASAAPGTEPVVAAPTQIVAPEGMTALPVTMTIVGPYEDAIAFLDDIQHTRRLFLVSALTGTVQEEHAAEAGRPATELGDLELKVEGFLYVLPSLGETTGDAEEEPAKEPSMPKPTDRNPVLPIEGGDVPTAPED